MTTAEICLLVLYLFIGFTLGLRQLKRHGQTYNLIVCLLALAIVSVIWLPALIVEHLDG